MVWVNPPNRVNYTVIPRIRNVQSRESFRCSTLRVPKCSTRSQLRVFETIWTPPIWKGGRFSARCTEHHNERGARGDAPRLQMLLAVATEDVRLYTLFLPLEP